jgi:hypothetical protein
MSCPLSAPIKRASRMWPTRPSKRPTTRTYTRDPMSLWTFGQLYAVLCSINLLVFEEQVNG